MFRKRSIPDKIKSSKNLRGPTCFAAKFISPGCPMGLTRDSEKF